MRKVKTIITIAGVFVLLFSSGNISDNIDHLDGLNSVQVSTKSVQTKTKSTQTKSKSTKKSSTPVPVNKDKIPGTVMIGTQTWEMANLNVITFRNGDTIPEARNNKEWVAAGESGKPAWCYYNNDPALGLKYGKLYNWYAVNDPRGLAPAGWTLAGDADWAKLISYLGGMGAAGSKMKSTSGWIEGNIGTNESVLKVSQEVTVLKMDYFKILAASVYGGAQQKAIILMPLTITLH